MWDAIRKMDFREMRTFYNIFTIVLWLSSCSDIIYWKTKHNSSLWKSLAPVSDCSISKQETVWPGGATGTVTFFYIQFQIRFSLLPSRQMCKAAGVFVFSFFFCFVFFCIGSIFCTLWFPKESLGCLWHYRMGCPNGLTVGSSEETVQWI